MRHQIRFTSQKLHQRLRLVEELVYRHAESLPPFRARWTPEAVPAAWLTPDYDDSGWDVLPGKGYWGAPQVNFVLRSSFCLPQNWGENTPAALHLPLGVAGDFSHPEAMVYIDGLPIAACDRHHQEVSLPATFNDGRVHHLVLHGWTGGTPILHFDGSGDPNPPRRFALWKEECRLVWVDQPTRDFLALARVALGVADSLAEDNPLRAHLYTALDEAVKRLDLRHPIGDAFYRSVETAQLYLSADLRRCGVPLDVQITAVGHAHLDVAWLWTLDVTRGKAARTFANVLHLMARFPQLHFVQSQPALYEFVRQDHPALFERIRQRVAEGRWEPIGGMWVEADCNLSGGESLARQFLLGREYFSRHFGAGAESPVLWLPDVFGYAWNLPQLLKSAGLEYFFTIKLGWNQYNRLPYDAFWWQGLDGTRVLTHFSTTRDPEDAFTGTYNASVTPAQAFETWRNFQQKDAGPAGETPPLLMVYGYGDGGGGPTREMLENLRLLGDFPGAPRLESGSVLDFFRRLERVAGERLPTWNGELYLEYHRGTYTTQARIKRANRKNEFRLHDAEFLASWASLLDPTYTYPHAELKHAWQTLCLNQFHDIIPGSSVGAVYEQALAQHADIEAAASRICANALDVLAHAAGGDIILVNPSPFARQDLALWHQPPEGVTALLDDAGQPCPTQRVAEGLLIDAGEIPPYALKRLRMREAQGAPPASGLSISPRHLENACLRVEFNPSGEVIRLYDKINRREVIPPGGKANQFQAFEDRPRMPDAWDIDVFYDDKMWTSETPARMTVLESGPLRASLEVERRILNSTIRQRISLVHNSPRLVFDTWVDWHERFVLLKVAFPVNVLAPQATYEIQFGNVERPTHRNTSWDWARFETCAHKWVDLSEGDYGVSLLNDAKYGHDICQNVIRLSLLRGTTQPDPQADMGEHTFTYALLPHRGDWRTETIAQAYALNDPIIVHDGRRKTAPPLFEASLSLVSTNRPNLVIETIKRAEDGRGLIVRLYESQRMRGVAALRTAFGLAEAWRTNLLEQDEERLPCDNRQVTLSYRPYQIITLRLVPQMPAAEPGAES